MLLSFCLTFLSISQTLVSCSLLEEKESQEQSLSTVPNTCCLYLMFLQYFLHRCTQTSPCVPGLRFVCNHHPDQFPKAFVLFWSVHLTIFLPTPSFFYPATASVLSLPSYRTYAPCIEPPRVSSNSDTGLIRMALLFYTKHLWMVVILSECNNLGLHTLAF